MKARLNRTSAVNATRRTPKRSDRTPITGLANGTTMELMVTPKKIWPNPHPNAVARGLAKTPMV